MANGFSHSLEQIAALFGSLSFGKRAALLLLFVFTIAAFIFLIIWSKMSNFQLLYSNLNLEDTAEVVSYLKDQKIPYKINESGSIVIPSEKIHEVRFDLASKGLPQGGGIGFEIFDHTKFGMTDFVQNVNYQRALQGELTRTINQLYEVDQSRVHLVIPKRSLFVEEEQEATASVVLKLKRGSSLRQEHVKGIIFLVASSVEGMRPENVTIIDIHGRILSPHPQRTHDTVAKLSNSQFEFQQVLEKKLETGVQSLLERAIGKGRAITMISADIDWKKTERTEEIYDPQGGVIRSKQSSEDNSSNIIPTGVPGVMSNIVNPQVPSNQPSDFSGAKRKSDVVNYEISKTVRHIIEPVGNIKKLHVAVLIDGVYEKKEGEEKLIYRPRTTSEMEKFEGIVKRAVGFNAERGDEVEVVNVPLETGELTIDENVPEWQRDVGEE